MHIQLDTALVVVAMVSSIVLLVNRGDKVFPVIAAVASLVALLIAFGVIALSAGKFRIDVILPALIAVSGVACWMRSKDKTDTTCATALSTAGMIQLLMAVRVLGAG